jgi:hypothetical protein
MNMFRITAIAFALCGCTHAAEQAIVTSLEAACVPLLSLETPAAPAICVPADVLIEGVGAYIEAHAGSKPALAPGPEGATVVPGELYAKLAAHPAVMGRRVTRCPKCPACPIAPGRVSP